MAAERISDPSYGAKTEDKGGGTEIRRRWSWWKRMCTQVRASFVRALREARGYCSPVVIISPHRHACNHTNMRIRAQFIVIKRAMVRHGASRPFKPATLHRDATPSSLRNVSSISLPLTLPPSLPPPSFSGCTAFLCGMHFVGGECFRNV